MLYPLENSQFLMNTVGPYGPSRGERVKANDGGIFFLVHVVENVKKVEIQNLPGKTKFE